MAGRGIILYYAANEGVTTGALEFTIDDLLFTIEENLQFETLRFAPSTLLRTGVLTPTFAKATVGEQGGFAVYDLLLG